MPKFNKKVVKEQKTPFKELSTGQKIGYIWEYYKYYMLAVVIIVVAVVSFVSAYKRNDYVTEFSLIAVDGKITGYDEHTDYITKEFTNYLGIDGKDNRVVCDYNYSLIQQEMDQEAYISQTKIYTLASTHSVDGYLASRDYIDFFSTDEEPFLMDLREILTDSELSKLSDYIVYYTKENGESLPIALDMSNTKIKTATDFTMKDPCYGIVVSSNNVENATAFIRFAFDL